jgi:CRP/FNR family cyclic AMP-dependent transcriptional regulator
MAMALRQSQAPAPKQGNAAAPKQQGAVTGEAEKKSGLLALATGETLFYEGDKASSLYIIQKGQLRLYKPKGKGFIELALLRAGEVIGEMAYFAEDESESKRSCSAQAIVPTEVIEISFVAFGKTMSNLNPWFKTIINTLASRLRKTNAKVKELESNSVSVGYGQNSGGYLFFKGVEVLRFFTLFYMTMKAAGEPTSNGVGVKVHKNTLKYYTLDIFNLGDVKFEEFTRLLAQMNFISYQNDKDGQPNICIFPEAQIFKQIASFYHLQRTASDDKKIRVTEKGELLLEEMLGVLNAKQNATGKMELNIKTIIDDLKNKGKVVGIEDLNDAKKGGLVSEVMVIDAQTMNCTVDVDKLRSTLPPLKVLNAVDRFNQSKTK